MQAAVRAGAAYFALVFALGVALGTARTLVLEPRLGAVAAVALELPFMLAAAWWLCDRLIARTKVAPAIPERAAMGAAAFILLIAAELGLALWTPGRSAAEYFMTYRETAGLLGLGGQILFASFPLLQRRRTAGSLQEIAR